MRKDTPHSHKTVSAYPWQHKILRGTVNSLLKLTQMTILTSICSQQENRHKSVALSNVPRVRRGRRRSSQRRPCHRKVPWSPPQGRAGRARRASPPSGVLEEGRRAGRAASGAQPTRPSRDKPSSSFVLRLLQGGSDRAFGFHRSPLRRPVPSSLPDRPLPGEVGPGFSPGAPPSFVPAPLAGFAPPPQSPSSPRAALPLEAPGSGPVWTLSL